MMFGVGESYEHRYQPLQALYDLQEETGGLRHSFRGASNLRTRLLGGRKWMRLRLLSI